MNLANKLTLLRVLLIPFFIVALSVEGIPYGIEIATGIFILASLTDKLDGYIARSRNMVTDFGKLMDPLADKLLVMSALVILTAMEIVPAWIVIVILAREFAVSGLRMLASNKGVVIAASWWGKIKTVIQMVAIILALLALCVKVDMIMNIADITMYAAAVLTIVSGIDYFVKNKKVIDSM